MRAIESFAPDIVILDATMPELTALNPFVLNSADRSIQLVLFIPSEDYEPVFSDGFDGYSVLLKETLPEARCNLCGK